jgi:ketosteroid isomerase-like protein
VNRRFLDTFNAGDVTGAARGVYTEYARILPPGAEAVQGREPIIRFWETAAEALGIEAVELSTVHLEPQGDTVYEIGRAGLVLAGGQTVPAKYVVIWKQEGGEWKWHVDIWNTDVG